MIYEFRTYRLKPGGLAEVEKRFGEAYEVRRKYSPLAAFWHTEIGPLNEIIHVWPYQDVAERARIRAEAAKDPGWPPKIADFILRMRAEIVIPFPFSPEMNPGRHGPFYELRYYTVKPGTIPDTMKRWEAKLPERLKFSPITLVGHVDTGEANGFLHIWPYASLDERMATRARAREAGAWPPPGGGDVLLTQATKIVLPAPFSPMQ